MQDEAEKSYGDDNRPAADNAEVASGPETDQLINSDADDLAPNAEMFGLLYLLGYLGITHVFPGLYYPFQLVSGLIFILLCISIPTFLGEGIFLGAMILILRIIS